MSWTPPPEPKPEPLGARALLRVARRGLAIAVLVFGGLAVLLAVRLVEAPLRGAQRPVTPWITVGVCRGVLWIMGLDVSRRGRAMSGRGAIVANHASWLDIFVLNACTPVCFVAKAEVAGWPGIGWLARATGTVFIRREARDARVQTALFETRLLDGNRLLFFPEGTSTDGQRVLPFKSTLFAAFFAPELRHAMALQAVSVGYHAPQGKRVDFHGWWGDMAFVPSLLQTLAQKHPGRAVVILHDPVRADAFPNRKTLSKHLEQQVREGHRAALAR